jgi:hypothetical protein
MDIQALNALPLSQSWLSALLAAAPVVGKLAGKLVGNRAQARVNEAGLNADMDRLAQQKADQDATNARANVATDTGYRNTQMGNAIRGGLLSGVQDAVITPPEGIQMGQITGGLRPSAIQNKTAMGDQFQRDAMMRYMQGAPGLKGDSPSLTPTPQAGKLDKILGAASFLGGLAGLGKDVYSTIKGGDVSGNLATQEGFDPSIQPINLGGGPGVPSNKIGAAGFDPITGKRNTRPVRFGG